MNAFEQNPARALRAVPPALKTFGRYEAHAEIGDGAMGRVYRGFDPMVGRFVAIKTVKAEYLTRETRSEYLRRFRREAQAAGRLAHPNIVSIFDVGEDYFVMEYVEGITLAELLRYRTALDVVAGLRVLAPVAEALDYAHRCGVVHRDIKPANIMVQPDGRPKLMDFGVARLETSAMTSSGQFFGSPSYMAPEQILGSEITHEADLFSFAVVAYEALTGKRPYQGDSITTIIYKVVNEAPALPRSVNPDLPAHFDEVFKRALCKQPAQRFPTGMEFISALAGEDLESTLADLVPEPIPEAKTPTLAPNEVETQAIDLTPARRRRRAVMWAVPAAALVALTVEIGLLVSTAPAPPPPAEPEVAAPATVVAQPGMVQTTPPGASVRIDGVEMGSAPVSMGELEPGGHRLRVEMAGHAPTDLTFSVTAGVPKPAFNLNMQPLSAPLRVTSEPPAALITVDGTRLGATPLDAPPLSPGRHEIRVEMKGYKPSVQIVTAEAGKRLDIHLPLTALPAPSVPADPRQIAAALPPAALPMPTPVPVFEGMFVNFDQVDVKPTKVSGEWATRPEPAVNRGITGTVEVEMVVTEAGHPTDLRLTQSAGAILDEAVIKALRTWRFEPALKNGVKVRTRVVRKQTFR